MKKQQKFALSLLTISVLSATAFAADTDSPFTMPLHLSNPGMHKTVTVEKTESRTKTATWDTTTTTGVSSPNKPNILLYLDDSGSMNGTLSGSYNSRAKVMRNVLNNLFNKKDDDGKLKYADKARWGVSWLGEVSNIGAGNRSVPLSDDYRAAINNVNSAKVSGGTPFLTGYVNAVEQFATVNDLQCSDNYIIAMTDGAANSDSYESMYKNGYSSKGLNPLLSSSTIWSNAGVSEYKPLTVGRQKFEPYQFGEDEGPLNYDYYRGIDHWALSSYGLSSNQINALDSVFLKQLSEPLEKNANIKTYTVAFGLGSSRGDTRTKSMLKAGASNGGQLPNGNKTYFEANDEESLQEAFDKMFEDMIPTFDPGSNPVVIKPGDPTFTDPTDEPLPDAPSSISTAEDQHALAAPAITGADKLFPQEMVALWLPIGVEGGLRSAELRFYKTDYTQNAKGAWDEEVKVDTAYGVPNYQYSGRVALMSEKDGRVRPMNDNFNGNNGYFALNHYNSPSDEWLKAMLPWQSRYAYDSSVNDHILSQTYTANTLYRERTYPMGDILESDIVTVGALVDEDQTVDFQGRKEFIVAAANDGLAYVFQSNSAAKTNNARNPYNLVMTYAPSELQRQKADDTLATHYKDIAHKDYATTPERPHLYMLSGGITAHTLNKPFNIDYMLGNAGRGAKGLYAMNLSAINESNDWTKDVTLFNAGAHRGGQETAMGYTVGYPSTARFGVNVTRKNSNGRVERYLDNGIFIATAVGSGFSTKTNLANQETALYLYDTLGGADVGIEGCGYDKNDMTNNHKNSVQCMGSKANRGRLLAKATMGKTGGLATPALFDVDVDGVVDYAFAGDYSGNMWRCDVRNYKQGIDCQKIFAGTPDRPVTSAPIIARVGDEHVVMWGTGSDMFPEDVTETKRQALYGVYQKFDELNTIVNDKDKGFLDKTFTENDLLTQELNSLKGSWETLDLQRKVSNEDINGKDGKRAYAGWMVELDTNGERVVVRPMLAWHTVYFATRVYGKSDKNPSAKDTQYNKNWTADEWRENGWAVREEPRVLNKCSTNKEEIKAAKGGWSVAQLINHNEENSTTTSGRCNNTTTNTTKETDTFQSTCTEQTQHKLTAEKSVVGGTPKLYSALIQLHVENGGLIFPSKRNTSYAILGDDRANATETGLSYLTEDQDKGLVSSTVHDGIVSWTSIDSSRKNYNSDYQGNYYERGMYTDFNKDGNKQNRPPIENACSPDDGKSKAQLAGLDKDGLNQYNVYWYSPHMNCLRRISWREIY